MMTKQNAENYIFSYIFYLCSNKNRFQTCTNISNEIIYA